MNDTFEPYLRALTSLIGDPISAAILACLSTAIFVGWLAGKRARRAEHISMRIQTARIAANKSDRWLDQAARKAWSEEETESRSAFGSILAQITPAISRLPLFGDRDRLKVQRLLVVANFRSADAANIMFSAKVFIGLISGVAAYFMTATGSEPMVQGPSAAMVFIVGLVGGSMIPELYVKQIAKRMRRKISQSVPDAMDLLVICAEAGLTLDSGLQRVSRELKLSAPEIARELTITEAELRMLPQRRLALENLVYRTDVPELAGLVVTLSQAEKYGTSLSQALRTISTEGRKNRMLRIEEKAARLPALMGMPLMLLILPPVVAVVAGPAMMRLFTSLS